MKNSDSKVLEIYLQMILDGQAFSNWENPPDKQKRLSIINKIIDFEKSKSFSLDLTSIQKVKNEYELNSLLEKWKIKEDEFKI
jgi:hypothetical protein